MVAISALKDGDVVYEVRRERAGNTLMRRTAVRSVKIVSVDLDGRRVIASWNGNTPKTFYERDVNRWKRNKPVEKPSALDVALSAIFDRDKQ